MKRTIKYVVFLFIVFTSLISYAYENEPDGFRGIKWGTDISEMKDMVVYGKLHDSTQMYERQNDEMQIGDAKIEHIFYLFWNNKLSTVMIVTKESANYFALREAVFAKFGRGAQKNQFIKDYKWHGSITKILLNYNQFTERGDLFFLSVEYLKKQEQKDKLKAKEGAEKGF